MFLFATAIVFAILFPRLTLPFGFAYIMYLMARPFTLKLTIGSRKQRLAYFIVMFIGISFMFFPLFATLYNVDTDFSALSSQLPEVERILNEKFFKVKVWVFEKYGYRLNVDPVKFIVSKLESNMDTIL